MATRIPFEDKSIVNIVIVERRVDGHVVYGLEVRCPKDGVTPTGLEGATELANALKDVFERYAIEGVRVAHVASARTA